MMKQKILMSSIMAVMLLLVTGCANEDNAQENNNNNGEEAVSTFQSEEPSMPETSSGVTRTSMKHTVSKGAIVYWSPGDRIYAEDDGGIYRVSKPATRRDGSAITDKKEKADRDAMFKFTVGKYTKPDRKVRYTGKNGQSANSVTIATTQTQNAPNNADHIGTDGDCGVAVARGKNGGYKFTLEHKASYLCFMPRIENAELARNVYLTKIVVTSDKNIAGNYGFNDNGLTGNGTSKTITLITKGSGKVKGPWNGGHTSVPAPGFQMSPNKADLSKSAYMVLHPGRHKLSIAYHIKDPETETEGIVTKKLELNCEVGKIYDITANLTSDIEFYNIEYYMWDPKPGFHYWKNNESSQSYKNMMSGKYPPKNNSDPRWYRELKQTNSYATQALRYIPNMNAMTYYYYNGEPYWDGEKLWSQMRHLYKGGAWIKKKSHINGFKENCWGDGASCTDYRSYFNDWWGKIYTHPKPTDPRCWIEGETGLRWKIGYKGKGKPQNSNIYFFLPAAGYYEDEVFYTKYPEYKGVYWTSTAVSQWVDHLKAEAGPGCCLHFDENWIGLEYDNRGHGYVAGHRAGTNSPTWFQ